MIGPVLEEIAAEYPKVRVVKLNVDEAPAVAQDYEVMSIPTLLAFEGGQVQKRIVGAVPKVKLLEELSGWLA
jgi:thioredoxin 1